MTSDSRKTKMVIASGILMLISVALLFVFAALLLNRVLPQAVDNAILIIAWLIGPLLFYGLALGLTNHEVLGTIYAVLFLLAIFAAVIGGVFTIRRKGWGLALAGAIGTLLTSPPLGIVALILLLGGRNEFRRESQPHQIAFEDKNHAAPQPKIPPEK